MRTFEYQGLNTSGRTVKGLVQALDPKDAREKLARDGILAERVQVAGAQRSWVWRRRDVLFALETRAAFYRELASILSAGLSLSRSLELLMDAPEMGANRSVIATIRDQVGEGRALATAVSDSSPRVTAFEHALIETGERAGRLDEVLNRLADFLEEEAGLRDRLIGAMIYPAIILVLSLLVGIGLLWFMLPAFQELLLESGIQLPRLTAGVMTTSRWIGWLLPAVIGIGIATWFWIRQRWNSSVEARAGLDRRLHGVPLFRSFYGVLVNVRFTRTFAILLGSGVPLLEALQQAAAASASPWVQQLMEREVQQVRHGDSLADALTRIPPLADHLPGWIRAGEASGDLTGMVEHAGRRSQQVWERRVARTMTLVESGLVVIVGAFVFILALAIILPILSMNQMLQ